MDVGALQLQMEEHFSLRAADYCLEAGRVRAEYVLNWGGFVNRSFRVSDGRRRLHVKLADEPVPKARLERWRELHVPLEERYHAPPMLGWVAIGSGEFEGPVFAWIDGVAPDRVSRALAGQVLPVIQRLHGDRDLAERLAPSGPPRLCLETYLGTYHHRFAEDLETVAECRPAFVSERRLAWMRQEAERLADLVRQCPAFQEPGDSPIHGDLWPSNLLLTREGEWYLLDWDDLALGDPALDLATLLGPSPADLQPHPWRRSLPAQTEGAVGERLALYTRAALLDWVIDSLADYVEVQVAPAHAGRVRAEKERVHQEALARYRELYG